jgi:hypothetical protein
MDQLLAFLNGLHDGPGMALFLIGMVLALGVAIAMVNVALGIRAYLSPAPIYYDDDFDDDDPDGGIYTDEDEEEGGEFIEMKKSEGVKIIPLDRAA